MIVKDTNDLLNFLVTQAESRKDWFGFSQQRLTAIALAHEIAKFHADKMTPVEVVDYATELNEVIYNRIIKQSRT